MTNTRSHAFDFLCGLAIVRMVFLHVVSTCGLRGDYAVGKLMAWTWFLIAFFFFKAGYFNKGARGSLRPYLIDRARRLLVPYVVWGVIGTAVYFAFLSLWPDVFARDWSRLRWHHLWRMSHWWGNPPLWFLFTFFATYICARATASFHWLVRLALCVAAPWLCQWLQKQGNPLWFSLSNLPMGYALFHLGRAWRTVITHTDRRQILGISALFLISFIINNRMHHGTYDMSLNHWDACRMGATLNLPLALCGISGVLLALPLPRIPVLGYVGQHSVVFFVMHWPLLTAYKSLRMVFHHSMARRWDEVIILMVVIFCLCSWLVPRVEKNPYLCGRYDNRPS